VLLPRIPNKELNFRTIKKIPTDEIFRDMPEDLTGCWVGPMPVEEFTDEFFPLPSNAQKNNPQFSKTYFASLGRCTQMTDTYESIVSICKLLNPALLLTP